jgi:hypothetical protein
MLNIKIQQKAEVLADGSYPARVLYVIDLGRQIVSTPQGEKVTNQVSIGFQVFEDEVPHTLSRRFTASLHKKASLKPVVEAITGKSIEDLPEFSLIELLGHPCLVQTQQQTFTSQTTGDEVTYVKLAHVVRPPKGMAVPGLTEDPFFFSIKTRDPAIFEGRLTTYQQALVQKSLDWQQTSEDKDFDDEIPF